MNKRFEMIGILDVEIAAKCPNIPLHPLYAFVNSPSSLHIHNVPKKIGSWQITSVSFQVTYPDDSTRAVACVNVGDTWVGTVQGTATPGTSTFGYTIYASGVDENGNDVTGYVLGKGDVEILDNDGHVTPGEHMTYMKLFEGQPQTPNEGDMWESDGSFYVWLSGAPQLVGDDSGAINELSAKVVDLSGHVHEEYIADEESKISADGTKTTTQTLQSPVWHMAWDSKEYDLSGTRTSAEYNPDVHESYDKVYKLKAIDYSFNVWQLDELTWMPDTSGPDYLAETNMWDVEQPIDVDVIDFGDGRPKLTWKTQNVTVETLATREWTQEQIQEQTSAIPRDKITDATGAAISANGDMTTASMAMPYFTITNGTVSYTLELYQDQYTTKWMYETAEFKYELQGYAPGHVETTWQLKYFEPMPGLPGMWLTKWTEYAHDHYSDDYVVAFPSHGFTSTRHDTYTLSSEHVASREWVSAQNYATSAELSAYAEKTDVHDATITLTQGGVTKGSFTVNQSSNATIELDAGGGGGTQYGTVTVYSGEVPTYSQGVTYGGNLHNGYVIDGYNEEHTVVDTFLVPAGQTFTVNYSGYEDNCGIRHNGLKETSRPTSITMVAGDSWTFYFNSCLAPDTLILMADGSLKMIADIQVGDKVATPFGTDTVTEIYTGTGNAQDTWTFDNGIQVKTIGRHRFYNVELKEPMYLEAWNIGEHALTKEGVETAFHTHTHEEGEFKHCTLFTEKWNLYWANGLLAGNRRSKDYENLNV